MNKTIVGLIILLVLAGGGYYLYTTNMSEADDVMMVEESMEKEDSMMDADDAMMEEETGEEDAMMMEEDAEVFELTGTMFEYDVTDITVTEGDTVKIVLTSAEGMHDWMVDDFDAATEVAQEGETVEVTFVADAAGEYEYYCSVGNHREMGMVGTLTVLAAN